MKCFTWFGNVTVIVEFIISRYRGMMTFSFVVCIAIAAYQLLPREERCVSSSLLSLLPSRGMPNL